MIMYIFMIQQMTTNYILQSVVQNSFDKNISKITEYWFLKLIYKYFIKWTVSIFWLVSKELKPD